MDLIKIDKKLKRISTVYESFKEDGRISPLEKDLLLGYIRELYDHVSEIEVMSVTVSQNLPNEPVKKTIDQIPVQETIIPKKEEKLPEAQPVHAEPELKLVHTAPAIENKPTQAGEPAVTYETKKEESVKPVSQEQPAAPDGLKSVFTIVKARDISERLAMSPVADIAKAMSINDKMLILKELFGNDTAVFNESITKLNGFSSFDEAKNYLIQNIAVKYNWVQEERLEKAEAFVKLVSRRYS
jgi:hypothetical protein